MRILHTADWHLGVKLHKRDLTKDHELFFSWLIQLIKDRKVDVLLISGDIFDHANPSIEARQLYYSFLKELIQVKCKVIITGGNHDSPGVLNGPKEILSMLNVTIIGNAQHPIENEIIELKDDNSLVRCIICAVPYLREAEIRVAIEGETLQDRIEQRRLGIKKHYEHIANICISKYDNVIPIIAMGHLFAAGASTSDSEREITIGNLADFDAAAFPSTFSYIALGHIHRPQKVAGKENIRYAGSPIPLSFSEKTDQKKIIELNIENNKINIQEHQIPAFRLLKKFTGTVEEIVQILDQFKEKSKLQPAFADLEFIMENNDPSLFIKINSLLRDYRNDYIEIINYMIQRQKGKADVSLLYDETKNIAELSPKDILLKKLEQDNVSKDNQQLIAEAFHELLEEINDDV